MRSNVYVEHLLHLIDVLQDPRRLLDFEALLQDRMTLRVLFVAVALVAAILVFVLILWTDAKVSDPGTPVEDDAMGDGQEQDEVDYKNLLDQSRQADEILTGSTDRYNWQQTESEMEVFVPLKKESGFADVKSKEIKVLFSSKTLFVKIRDVMHLEGELYAEVIPSDCTWQIDDSGEEVDGSSGSGRRLWITLAKRTKTARRLHWTCVLRGDQTVDTGSLGPMVSTLDASDPAALKKAVADLRQRVRDKNK